MKYIFNLLLLISSELHAREIVLVHYEQQSKADAEIVVSTLINQLELPREYIKMEASPCIPSYEAIATVCVIENGAIEIVQQNNKVMKKLLASFGGLSEQK